MLREPSSVELSSLPLDTSKGGANHLSTKVFFGLLWDLVRPFKKEMILASLSLVLAAAVVLCFGWGLKYIPDFNNQFENDMPLKIGLYFVLGNIIVLTLASFGRSYYFSWISERAVLRLREKMFNHLLKLDVGFFEYARSGEIMSRLNNDPLLIQIVLGTSLGVALRNFIMFVGGATMMALTSSKLSLYIVGIVPILIIPISIFGRSVKKLSRQVQDTLGGLNGFLEERIDFIYTVQAFNHEKNDKKTFINKAVDVFYLATKRNKMRALLACCVIFLVFLAITSILWVGYMDVQKGSLQMKELVSFIYYAILVASTSSSFGELYADIQRASGALERIIEFLNTSSSIKQLPKSKRRSMPKPGRGIIAVHNVSFAYSSQSDRVVLKDLTFSVSPGEKIAIVGLSGAGKSTILSLLMRFYDPQSGVIFMDGLDIRDVGLEELRSRISIVTQEPAIFADTLYNNLLYGNPDASVDDIWIALKHAHLDDFVYNLPKGLDTFVGPRGVRLSGGQKQRLSIARALLRNTPILLLDEATNSLDAQNEQGVQAALRQLLQNRTTIVVAHRLSTILSSNRILLIDKGRVSAMGTHAELMHHSELYKKLITLQFDINKM